MRDLLNMRPPIEAPGTVGSVGCRSSHQISPEESIYRFLATDHLLTGLKGRAVSSGIVTIISQGIQFSLNFVSIVVLARLLSPQDFGVVAMVGVIIGFCRIFNEAGLSTATVQREGIKI